MKTMKKGIALILALVLCLGLLPMSVFAADADWAGVDDNTKFQVRVSSKDSNGDTGAVTASVDKDYNAKLVIDNAKVNPSNVSIEMWMQNVSSLTDGKRHHYPDSPRTIQTGLSKADQDLSVVALLFNGITDGNTITANCDGKKVVYTFAKTTGENQPTVITATPDSYDAVSAAWHNMVNDTNFKTGANPKEAELGSYIVIANGSSLQAGGQKLVFENEQDLLLDNFNDIGALNTVIRDAVKLTDADDQSIQFTLKAGTALAVSSSYAELLRDVTVTVKIPDAEQQAAVAENLADSLVTLRDAENMSDMIKGLLGVVGNVVGAVQYNPLVNIDFAAPAKVTMTVSSTPINGTEPNSVVGTVDADYVAKLVVGEGEVSANNVKVDLTMENIASLGITAPRSHPLEIKGDAGEALAKALGKTGKNSSLDTINALLGLFDGAKINADCDGKRVTYTFSAFPEFRTMYAMPDSTQAARDAWQNIVNKTNFTVDTKSINDSYIIVAYGSTLQIGGDTLVFEKPSDLLLDNFSDLSALNKAIRDKVQLVPSRAVIASDEIQFTLKAGTTLAVSNSYATLNRDVTVTIGGITLPDGILKDLRDDFGATAAKMMDAENETYSLFKIIGDALNTAKGDGIDVSIQFADPTVPAFEVKDAEDATTVEVGATTTLEPVFGDIFGLDPENPATKDEDSGEVTFNEVNPAREINLTAMDITWVSDKEDIAIVDANGTVTGVAAGEATITATATNLFGQVSTAEYKVEVTAVPVENVELNWTEQSIGVGEPVDALVATVTPDNATDKAVVWTSSDENVATVDANGNVTGVGPGTATITATAGGVSASATVEVHYFTVTWQDDEGNVLYQDDELAYGATSTYPEALGEPQKDEDAQFVYGFLYWMDADNVALEGGYPVVYATGDTTITAVYTTVPKTYTVTWVSYDNGEILDQQEVEYGVVPVYNGDDPVMPSTEDYTYTFIGWDQVTRPVTRDVTYTGLFTAANREYTVIWVDEDGTELYRTADPIVVRTNTMNTAYEGETPTKAATAQYTYDFSQWSLVSRDLDNDTVTYQAVYSSTVNTYTVTWADEDGSVLETDVNVAYGAVPVYNSDVPAKAGDAQFSYTFAGWDPAPAAVAGDVTYTAQYSRSLNSYTVTWANDDGSILETATVAYGATPNYNGTPTKAADGENTYAFAGWDQDVAAVTGDVTYTATYTATPIVTEIPVEDVEITGAPTAALPAGGDPVQLTAVISPADATNQTVVWASDNENVATVDQNGNVTPVAAGTATITATAADGDIVAQVTITVDPVTTPSTGGGGSSRTSGRNTTPATPVTPVDIEDEEVPLADLPLVYADVVKGDWYRDAVAYVTNKGYMNGINATTFDPNGNTTRGMVATVLYRMEGSPDVASTVSYPDVAEGQYYTEAVAWASANGIVKGYGDGNYGPNDLVTREQLVTILYRYADFKGYDVSAADDLSSFSDADKVGNWAEDAVEWSVAVDLIEGISGALVPQGNATRAQLATVLMRMDDLAVKA